MVRRSIPFAVLTALLVVLAAAPAVAQLRYVGDKGLATVGTLSCKGVACEISAPKRVKVKVGERSFWAQVLAPKRLAADAKAKVRVKLGALALADLAGRTTTIEVRIAIRQGKSERTQLLRQRLRRAALPAGGGGGSGNPTSGPLGAEPPLLARPATAVDVNAVQVSWYPRDSWIRYVSSGSAAGDGILFAAGATGSDSTASECPDRPSASDAQLPYRVAFTPRASWFDAASGSAGIYGQGAVTFRWQGHGIDLTAADPEIEISGAASRAIFRFQGNGSTPYPNQRAALLSLDTSAGPAISNGGKTFTYSLMRGTLTADGVNVFAGFYTPPDNDEFGCVSVAFTTP
jgi:Htaa protein